MSDEELKRRLEAHKQNMEDAKLAHAERRAFTNFANQAAIEMTSSSTKAFLLINGGAAVAMLGFMATLSGKNELMALGITSFVHALILFGWGVASAAACSGLAYCVMYFQAVHSSAVTFTWIHPYIEEEPASRWLLWTTNIFHVLTVVSGIAALVFFVLGVSSVAEVVASAGTAPESN